MDAQVHKNPGQTPAACRQAAETVLGRRHEPELVGEGLGIQAPALIAAGHGAQVALPGGQARTGGVRADVDVVARNRLVQDRGALHPRPHQLLAVGQGAHDDAGPTLPAGTARLLVLDGAVAGFPEAHSGAAQAVGRVEDPADDGVPGLVGHLLRPGRVVLRAQGAGRVGAQVPVEAAGIGAGAQDVDGDGVLLGDDPPQLLGGPGVGLLGVHPGAQDAAHPQGVALRADPLGLGRPRRERRAQVRGEVQRGAAGDDVRLLELDVQGGRQVLGQSQGPASGEVARLPGDDVDLTERGDRTGLGGGGQGGGQPLQCGGQRLQSGAVQVPGVLPLGLGLSEIRLLGAGAVGGLGGSVQLAGDLLERRGEETEVSALLPGGDELDGGLQTLQEVAAQELVGAGRAVDGGHAVAQGALGTETLDQPRGRVVGQDGPAGQTGAGGRLGVVCAQKQGVLVGKVA